MTYDQQKSSQEFGWREFERHMNNEGITREAIAERLTEAEPENLLDELSAQLNDAFSRVEFWISKGTVLQRLRELIEEVNPTRTITE